jgi:carbamate kinase
MRRVVAALGGNAFVRAGAPITLEGELRFACDAVSSLEPFLAPGEDLVVTHGNGPQVGHQLIRVERSAGAAYRLPLDVCVAETQGELGYVLAQALGALLARRGLARPVAAIVTRTEVDPGDEAFWRPSKPVGPVLDPARAAELRGTGAALIEDVGRGLRRAVASPAPRRIVEIDVVRQLLALGTVVVAAGGGGVPVAAGPDGLRGVEAVVDKDLTAALLAEEVGADLLLVLTDVPCAYTDYLTPRQAPVRRATAREARALLAGGHFAPGSMKPKVEACARFASAAGRRAIVCQPSDVPAALSGEAGTTVLPDGSPTFTEGRRGRGAGERGDP